MQNLVPQENSENRDAAKSVSEEKSDHVFTQPKVRGKRSWSSPQFAGASHADIDKNKADPHDANKVKRSNKKVRTLSRSEVTLEEVSSSLLPASALIEKNSNKYPLSFTQMSEFLYASYRNEDLCELAAKYTTDISILIGMLSEIKGEISARKLKYRITQLINKFTNFLNDVTSDESYVIDDSEI